ncbi:MAG: hypothetical protein M0036_19610 [Desulfobacteraceae bacterium]|nr:hypothetical protein [Desulfobacteraceae bacterium]
MRIRNPIHQCLPALLLTLTCLAVPAGAHADQADSAVLRHEVQTLQQTVQELTQRVAELEKRIAAAGPVPSIAPQRPSAQKSAGPGTGNAATVPAAIQTNAAAQGVHGDRPSSVRESWRRLDRRMTAEQVEELLGKPQQQFPLAGKIVWYYHYPDNHNGTVTFFQDMRVAGWQPPPAGGF